MEIGRYGAEAAATGALAPSVLLLDAVNAAFTTPARPVEGGETVAWVREYVDLNNRILADIGPCKLADSSSRIIADLSALIAAYESAVRERETLEAQLHACRRIRRYTAFVLAGDENADVQLAADGIKAQRDRARAALLAAVRAKVEGMAVQDGDDHSDGYNTAITEVLAALDTIPEDA